MTRTAAALSGAAAVLFLWGCGGGANAARPVQVAAMGQHACARWSDGSVRCAGSNGHGELGDGSNTDRRTFEPVVGLPPAVDVTVGVDHGCALTQADGVWCWGANARGQLGDGSKDERPRPARVVGLENVRAISAGATTTCAVVAGGTVRCWGGSLAADANVPGAAIAGLDVVDQIALGADHACARRVDGSVRCWGENADGRIGDGTAGERKTEPVVVAGLTGVRAIALGASHSCALMNDGTVACWGSNKVGQLGDGTGVDRKVPVAVRMGPARALFAGADASCATLEGSNRLECWGTHRRAGIDELRAEGAQDHFSPRAYADLTTVAGVALTPDYGCALLADGTFRCFDSGAVMNVDF